MRQLASKASPSKKPPAAQRSAACLRPPVLLRAARALLSPSVLVRGSPRTFGHDLAVG